jgi:site-specific DNA recombinase
MLQRLIEDCRKRSNGVVIFYKLDRLSRSRRHAVLIEEVFIPNDVDFISISENFDTTTRTCKA